MGYDDASRTEGSRISMFSGVGSDRGLEGANDAMALAVAGSKQLPFEFLLSTGSHVACSRIEQQQLSLTLLELKTQDQTKHRTRHDTSRHSISSHHRRLSVDAAFQPLMTYT